MGAIKCDVQCLEGCKNGWLRSVYKKWRFLYWMRLQVHQIILNEIFNVCQVWFCLKKFYIIHSVYIGVVRKGEEALASSVIKTNDQKCNYLDECLCKHCFSKGRKWKNTKTTWTHPLNINNKIIQPSIFLNWISLSLLHLPDYLYALLIITTNSVFI